MPIKNITDRIRLPRLGKIKLGIKNPTGGAKATDYFVCPEDVIAAYGETPKKLDIIFTSNVIEDIFPCYYKKYGASAGLKCKGDGEIASGVNPETGKIEERECLGKECPEYKNKSCKMVGSLKFMLPKVGGFGIYQIDVGGINSILNINSVLLAFKEITKDRLTLIPFVLLLTKEEVQTPENKKRKVTILKLNIENFKLTKYLSDGSSEKLEIQKSGMPELKAPEEKPAGEIVLSDEKQRALDVLRKLHEVSAADLMDFLEINFLSKTNEPVTRLSHILEKDYKEICKWVEEFGEMKAQSK